MALVRFLNVGLEVSVPPGTTILSAARRAGAPEGSRCGGVCACSTCHVYVERGLELLSPQNDEELDLLTLSAKARRENSRLGCQSRILADATIEVIVSEESFQAYLDAYPEDRDRVMALWPGRP
jgi:2Fe-2S ferredoxin